jgi:tripartite-type tricarboxylate transporter receptor subunit TctC
VDIKIAYAKAGITSKPMNLEQTAQFVKNEIAKYTKIAKDAGIEPQ